MCRGNTSLPWYVSSLKTKMKPKNYVWVIETLDNGKFVPCADAKLSRADARRSVKFDWKTNWPEDTFRITKYISSK